DLDEPRGVPPDGRDRLVRRHGPREVARDRRLEPQPVRRPHLAIVEGKKRAPPECFRQRPEEGEIRVVERHPRLLYPSPPSTTSSIRALTVRWRSMGWRSGSS